MKALIEELELLEIAGNPFSQEDFLAGEVTPVFFASALTNFGVEPFFDAFIHLAPCPHARLANRLDGTEIEIDPVTTPFQRLCVQTPGQHGQTPSRQHGVHPDLFRPF